MYINREILAEEIKSLSVFLGGDNVFNKTSKESVLRIIYEQPTADVVEVVRCKDCLYNETGNCEHSMNYPLNNTYAPDFYCAKGLRVRRCKQ